jgi:GNAT superfamily N-acetyltransferase
VSPRAEISTERADAEPARSLLAAMAAELDALYARVPGSLDSVPATPAQMAPPDGSFLVIRRGGRPVACGGVKRLDAETGEIKRMYVVPAARNRGLGRLLLEALEAEARRLGYLRIRLDTGPEQPAARSIYERGGYRPIPDYNGNPYAAHWFEKELGAGG